MIRMIIADDESIIRNGLEKLVLKSGLDIGVVALAKDGEEALKLILELEPDIVLIDINMPKLRGIDVIEEVNKHNIKVKFIIISGYDDFEYVRKALHLKVEDYLLKPIDKLNFKETLANIIKDIKPNKQLSVGQLIVNDIKNNYTKSDYSLNDLEDKFNLSASYITRLIKQEVNYSFNDYLIKLRIDKAKELMKQDPNIKIFEVAISSGFTSQHYFSRLFKSKVGVSPLDYHKNCRDSKG